MAAASVVALAVVQAEAALVAVPVLEPVPVPVIQAESVPAVMPVLLSAQLPNP